MFKPVTILVCLLLPLLSFSKGNGNLQFISNKGQITDQYHQTRTDIDAKIEQGGVTLFVGSGQLHYQWVKNTDPSLTLPKGERTNNIPLSPLEGGNKLAREGEVIIYRMDVVLVGANKNAEVIFEEPTGYHENYYTEYTGEAGVQAKGYQKVTYKDIWPGIDWVLYTPPAPLKGREGDSENEFTPSPHGVSLSRTHSGGPGDEVPSIKYDFIVHPGGNVNDIQLRYEGATELSINDGALTATTPYGRITEAAPYSYEAVNNKTVATEYVLNKNTLSFKTADHEGTLVIDPQLAWATYYGGTNLDEFLGFSEGVNSGIIGCGYTRSTNNIATTGAFQTTLSATADAFLAAFNSSGTRLWATYYGGTGNSTFNHIASGGNGIIYCTGNGGTGLATTGAHQTSPGGMGDGLLVKFNTNGSRLWATYYGGSNDDRINGCAVDGQGNVYIAGYSKSSNNIATNNGHQSTRVGTGEIAFLANFSSTGTRQWGTYYGQHLGQFSAIDCDYAGNVYVIGVTKSDSTITTSGTYKPSMTAIDSIEMMLVKFNTNGQRIWGTYYGGESEEYPFALECNSTDIYVAGYTRCSTGIATTAVYKPYKDTVNSSTIKNYFEGFVAKFTSSGQLSWGSYYGNDSTFVHDVAVAPTGIVYISGYTASTSGIATTNAYQPVKSGGFDMFWAELTSTGHLLYGSYFGGTASDGARGNITVTDKHIVMGGGTASGGLATNGAHQQFSGGLIDGFIAVFEPDTVVYITPPYTDTVWCAGDTVGIPYEVTRVFQPNNVFTIQLSDSSGSFTSPMNIGSINSDSTDTIACPIPDTMHTSKNYRMRIIGTAPIDTFLLDTFIHIKAIPVNFTMSHNSPLCTGDTIKLTASSTTNNVNYSWAGPNSFASNLDSPVVNNVTSADSGTYVVAASIQGGCTLSDSALVTINKTPEVDTVTGNSPVCYGDSVLINSSVNLSGVSFGWTGPNSFTANTQNLSFATATPSLNGYYYLTVSRNGCISETDSVNVLVYPAIPFLGISSNSPVCVNQDLQLTASNINGASYNWYGPSLFTATSQNPTRYSMTFTDSGYYYVYATVSGCASDTDSVRVVVNTDPVVNIFPSPGTTICKGEEATFTAVPTNAGTATYGWSVNHISTSTTGTTFKTSTLNNGDVVRCEMISTGTCATAYTDTSNGITMTVNDVKVPSVTIRANPNTSLYPNEPVTFTASPTNGGNNPTYQWLRNGNPINGAQSAVWGANANFLNDGDDICVVLFSDHVCPEPDTALSNCIMVDIRLSVEAIAGNSNITIYPNPATNELHIEGIDNGTVIELYDVVGKKIHHATTSNNKYSINMSIYAAGNYILKITTEAEGIEYRKISKQ